MATSQPDEVTEPTAADPAAEAPPGTAEAPRGHQRWPWLTVAVLVLAAVLGTAAGVGIVLRGRSFGTQQPTDTAARPTFVIAAPPPSPSAAPSPTAAPPAAAQPASTSTEAYTVEAGDTLRSIAQQVYGDQAQWPRIYDANRQAIGPDPDALSAGTRLTIPRP